MSVELEVPHSLFTYQGLQISKRALKLTGKPSHQKLEDA